MAFNEAAYLKANPDVAAEVKSGKLSSGAEHFQKFGKKEGRAYSSTSKVNSSSYLKANPDVAKAVQSGDFSSAAEHYDKYGRKEGRRGVSTSGSSGSSRSSSSLPSNFNSDSYLSANPDVAKAIRDGNVGSAQEHYQQYGRNENRLLTTQAPPGFDESAYLRANPDVARAIDAGDISSGFQHYATWGAREGRDLGLDSGGLIGQVQAGSGVPTTNVTPNQTSQGQLQQMLASDSPLMQQAATMGQQRANQRGLLNSSMSSQAAQAAMISAATPFAQQDGQTYFQADQANADRQQQDYMSRLGYQQQRGLNEQQYGFQTGLNEQRFGFDSALNEQQADLDLNRLQASSTANAWGVMSNNITDIVAQSMDAINNIQANPNIDTENKSSMIEQVLEMRDTDIEFQSGLYDSLSGYLRDTGLFPNL